MDRIREYELQYISRLNDSFYWEGINTALLVPWFLFQSLDIKIIRLWIDVIELIVYLIIKCFLKTYKYLLIREG